MNLPILVDCDDVLADFCSAALAIAAKHGVLAMREDLTDWDFAKVLQWPELQTEITLAVRYREFCYKLPERVGGIAWLRQVEAEFGADRVFVCTSPWNAEWCAQRAAWLDKRGVPLRRQMQLKAKHLVPGHLIDDAMHNCEGRKENQAFLVAAPWNRELAGVPRGDLAGALSWLREVA